MLKWAQTAMQYFITQCQASCYPRACESPLTQSLHVATRTTHFISAICTSQAACGTVKGLYNKYTRGGSASSWQGIACTVCVKEKKKIHFSQLCFNSNRTLVPSKGQPELWWCGLAGADIRGHLSVSPGQQEEWWVTLRAPVTTNRSLLPKKLISGRLLWAVFFLICW